MAVTSRCGTQSSTWPKPSKRPSSSSTSRRTRTVELHVRQVLEQTSTGSTAGLWNCCPVSAARASPDPGRAPHRRRRRGARGSIRPTQVNGGMSSMLEAGVPSKTSSGSASTSKETRRRSRRSAGSPRMALDMRPLMDVHVPVGDRTSICLRDTS